MRKWPRPYLEPSPAPRHSEWKVFGKVVVVAWLSAHALFDFVAAMNWITGSP
jgi:hypothetical protein